MVEKPKVGIITVSYNTDKQAVKLIDTLYKYTDKALFQFLLIDNGSAFFDINRIWSRRNKKKLTNTSILLLPENIGLTKAWNIGIKYFDPMDVILVGSDVEFCDKGWLQNLLATVKERIDFGIIHARCLTRESDKIKDDSRYDKYYPTDRNSICEVDRGRHDCVYVRRSVFKDIGLYDERFFVFGSDVDFQRRAQSKAWKLGYCGKSKVVHLYGLSTDRADAKEMKEKDVEVFHRIHSTDE